MLVFIPIFVLFGTAIAVLILQLVPRGTGIAWFTSIFLSAVVWIIVLVFRNSLPISFTRQILDYMSIGVNNLAFRVDVISWPFVITISSLVIGTLLVSSSRIGIDTSPEEWASILIIGALGLLVVSAANIMSVVLVLGLLDFTELRNMIFSKRRTSNDLFVRISFLWRILGLGLLMAASAWQISLNGSDAWISLTQGPAHLVFFACLIRLGLYTDFRFKETAIEAENGLFVIRNIIEYFAIFVVIIQIPFHPFIFFEKGFLVSVLFIFSIHHALKFSQKQFWTIGIISWLKSIGILISAMYVLGISSPGITFSISAVVLAFVLFSEYQTNLLSRIMGLAAVVGFSGLPLTPNVLGYSSFGNVEVFPGVLFLFPISLLLYGSYRAILGKRFFVDKVTERWVVVLSTTGIFVPIITIWVIFFINNSPQTILQISTPALFTIFLFISLIINKKLGILRIKDIGKGKSTNNLTNKIGNLMEKMNFSEIVLGTIQSLIIFVRGLFDGDGGILWSVLSLVLIITIIRVLGN